MVVHVWIDGQTNGQNNGQTDRYIDGQTMDGHAIYMHRDAKNNDFPIDFAIFTIVLRTDPRINQQTDGLTYPLVEMR